MRDKLPKIVIIIGVTLLLISFIVYIVKLNNINNSNTDFLKNMRKMDSHLSDEEYEKNRLPLFVEMSKYNAKVKFFTRVFLIGLGTLILVGLTKEKNHGIIYRDDRKP